MPTLTDKLDALAIQYEDKITLANAHTQLRLMANEAAQLAVDEMRRMYAGMKGDEDVPE